jgi:hypothetical protein
MDRHRGVAQLRLGADGPERQRTVLDVDELPVAILTLDLDVREHRLAARAPVDDAIVLVDQAFLVEADEGLAHGPAQARVHREALARPVAGGAEALELADDIPARFLLPLPGHLEESLAPDVVACLAQGGQLALEDDMDGDPAVVGARQPQRVVAIHPLVADEDVLQRVVERVPPVQRAGDVGRRDDDAVRLLRRRRVGVEEPARLPLAVPARLDAARVVAVRDFSHCSQSL